MNKRESWSYNIDELLLKSFSKNNNITILFVIRNIQFW